jgi:hypothetical protein
MYPMQQGDEERLDALFQAYTRRLRGAGAECQFHAESLAAYRVAARVSHSLFVRMANAFVTAAVRTVDRTGVYTSVSTPRPRILRTELYRRLGGRQSDRHPRNPGPGRDGYARLGAVIGL